MNALLCKLAIVLSLLLALGWESNHESGAAAHRHGLSGILGAVGRITVSQQRVTTALAKQLIGLVDAWQKPVPFKPQPDSADVALGRERAAS